MWFALVADGANLQFELPAIAELDDGYADLVNGWQVPYARVIDRTECDPDVASFAEFLDKHDRLRVDLRPHRATPSSRSTC